MNSFKSLVRGTRLVCNNNLMIRYASSAAVASKNSTSSSTSTKKRVSWKLPSSDEDYEKYLMRWENVCQIEFLQEMRSNVIKYGMKNMSEKQKQGIKNHVNNPFTKYRRV